MMSVLIFLLVFSVSLVFYSYVVFPLLLELIWKSRKASSIVQTNSEFIPVSIIISVYNEESIIGRKLESILNSAYPKEKIEILIGSDASDDKTNEILQALAAEYSSIRFYSYIERRGKPSVINDLVEKASHSIIVFTDANVLFEQDMLGRLMKNFSNEKIGLAGANILNIGLKRDGISIQEKSYIERENMIKYREGKLWGTMMGPFGGCYALRKNLFEKVPAHFLVDDFFICMKVIERKFHAINDLEAICYEDVSNDIRQEYRRKARISAGNFQNLETFKHFLLKPFSAAGFCFISHKVLRWLTPFFILVSWLTLMLLSFHHPVFFVLLAGEILILLTPLIDRIFMMMGIHIKPLRFVSYFVYMNLALIKGFFRYMRGIDSGVWTPTKRN